MTKIRLQINLFVYLYPVTLLSLVTSVFIWSQNLEEVHMLDMHSLLALKLRAFMTLSLSSTVVRM